jgi:hypothetical protein
MGTGYFAPDEGDELSVKGEVETTSVPDLLRSISHSGETGVLTFRSGDVTKSLYLQQGRIVFATSNDPDERLGESLLVRGRITPRQYMEASRLIRPGRRLGAILVEIKALEPEELMPALEQQVREIVMEVLTWTSGEYELVIKELKPDDIVARNLSTENLILEGIRRSRAWSRVLRGIGGIDQRPVQTGETDLAYKLELTEEEQEVLSHVNGRSTVEQICQVSYLSHFETCRILWALLVLGIVRRSQAADAATVVEGVRERQQALDLEGVVEQFNQMFSRIYGFLSGRMAGELDAFMESCLEEVSRQYGRLFDGVDLKSYGRADFDQMLANVADLPADQRHSLMIAGLNELVFVIQLGVRVRRGKEEEAVVSGIIKDGFKKIGGA